MQSSRAEGGPPCAPPRAGTLASELKAGPGQGHSVSGSGQTAASPGGVHSKGIRLWLFLKDRSSGENYFINVTPNVIMEINKVAQGLNPSREEVNSADMHIQPPTPPGIRRCTRPRPPPDRPHDVGAPDPAVTLALAHMGPQDRPDALPAQDPGMGRQRPAARDERTEQPVIPSSRNSCC